MTTFGAVPVGGRNFFRLLQNGEAVLLFPGGVREVRPAITTCIARHGRAVLLAADVHSVELLIEFGALRVACLCNISRLQEQQRSSTLR